MAGAAWRVAGESISMERLDGETILINFDSGQYFSFDGSSADVLWLVAQEADRTTWRTSLTAAWPGLVWDAGVDAGIDTFLAALSQAGVIVPAGGDSDGDSKADSGGRADGPASPLPADCDRGAWTAPSIQANDDLADLLIIDPIHDASDDGWPEARPTP